MDFAEQIVAALGFGNQQSVDRLIDWAAVFERASDGLPIPKQTKSKVQASVIGGLKQKGLSAQLADAGRRGVDFRLVRTHVKDGDRHALVRMVGDDGLNYFDFRLSESSGSVRAVDIYTYLSGEEISAALRRNLVPLAASINRNWVQKAAFGDTDFVAHQEEIQRFVDHANNNRADAALRAYRSLPVSLQEAKNLLILRYRAASTLLETRPQEMIDAVADFKRLFPNDACIDFLSLDALIVQEEFTEALASIDRFERALGGDPYLDVLRAELLISAGENARAVAAARRVAAELPEIEACCTLLLGAGILTGDNQAIYDGLTLLEEHHDSAAHNLHGKERLEGFVQSDLGKKWHRDHGVATEPDTSGGAIAEPNADAPAVVADEDDEADEGWGAADASPFAAFGSEFDPDAFHKWQDRTGKFTVEAKLIDFGGESITLEKRDGKQVTVPTEKLSHDSIAQAMKLMARRDIEKMKQRMRSR